MNWLLVFVIAGSPVKTDLVFPSIAACMLYERQNAKVLTDRVNESIKQMRERNWAPDLTEQNRTFLVGQMYSGTCIPTMATVNMRG